jgi:hypothetical protein
MKPRWVRFPSVSNRTLWAENYRILTLREMHISRHLSVNIYPDGVGWLHTSTGYLQSSPTPQHWDECCMNAIWRSCINRRQQTLGVIRIPTIFTSPSVEPSYGESWSQFSIVHRCASFVIQFYVCTVYIAASGYFKFKLAALQTSWFKVSDPVFPTKVSWHYPRYSESACCSVLAALEHLPIQYTAAVSNSGFFCHPFIVYTWLWPVQDSYLDFILSTTYSLRVTLLMPRIPGKAMVLATLGWACLTTQASIRSRYLHVLIYQWGQSHLYHPPDVR